MVSFPRTGSHWLRMLMELYFERPSLVRAFYFHNQTDFLLHHTHDLDLKCERKNVIYLYRDPVDTIYSQLKYHKEKLDDVERIVYLADLYGRHLDKWLHQETFTEKKLLITYEEMNTDLISVFKKITRFFDETLDESKLQTAAEKITKDEVKQRTKHDKQVVQLGADYESVRTKFRETQSQLIWNVITEERPYLVEMFKNQLT